MPWQDKIRDPNCELCPLHEEADHVCLMGQGSRKSNIMVVGEAPGEREDEEHVAFVGPSGQLLRRTLREVGISPEECYITNVAKCRPPDNRNPTKPEARVCAETYLAQEIEKVAPEWILGVGNAPLAAFTRNSGITKHRGKLYQLGVGNFFPTFHPAYVLRSPQHGPTFRADLERFARLVRGEAAPGAATRSKIVRTTSQLKWLLKKLEQAPVISFDIETSSEGSGKTLRYHKPWDPEGKIVMVGFSWEPGMGVAVPIHHAETPWKDPDRVLRLFKRALENRAKKIIAHNGKFDCTWMAWFGIFIRLTFDTMLAAHMLDENRSKALETLAQVIFGVDGWKDGGDITKDAFNSPLRQLGIYQCKDVDYTLRLYYEFKKQFKDQERLARIMAWVMMPASDVLTQVETLGMYVHEDRLQKQLKRKRKERDQLELQLRSFVPKLKRGTINFRSPQQVGEWLFKDLKLNPVKQTKTGAESTDEHVLKTLYNDHPAIPLLLKFRTVDMKDLRTYLEKWDIWRDKRNRIHTTYKLFGTVTARLSSEKPNMQQVPEHPNMRSVFGAPRGWLFLEADYAQIEYRVVAMLANEPTMQRFLHMGVDVHMALAAELTHKTPAEIKKSDATGDTKYREHAKPVTYGFLYGMGAPKFVDYAFDNFDLVISEEESAAYRAAFFRLYSRLPAWHDRMRRLAHRYGQVQSPMGRIRHLPDIHSNERRVVIDTELQAINSPVQATASDLMLISMVRLAPHMHPNRRRMVGTFHDAIGFEVRPDYLDDTKKLVKKIMEDTHYVRRKFGTNITVPIRVDFKAGQYWGG
jgi:uracil-DNA glycosylase family 4